MGDLQNAASDALGKAKEAAGDLVGDNELKAEGQIDQASATIREVADDVKAKATEALGDANQANDMVKDAKDALSND